MEEHTTLNHNTEQDRHSGDPRDPGDPGHPRGGVSGHNMATKWPLQVAASCG